MRKLRLARGGRVLDAVAEVRAIGRADTVADAVLLAAFQLGDDIGIGDVAAGHADEIDNLLANGVARGGQIVDPRCVKDWQPDLAPEAARPVQGRARAGRPCQAYSLSAAAACRCGPTRDSGNRSCRRREAARRSRYCPLPTDRICYGPARSWSCAHQARNRDPAASRMASNTMRL